MPKGENQEKQRYTIEQVRSFVNIPNYRLIERDNFIYKSGQKQKLEIYHEACGKSFFMRLRDFKRGSRCPNCAPNKRITDDDVDNFIKCNLNTKIKKISHYVRSNDLMDFQCLRCGLKFQITFNALKNSNRCCPSCDAKKVLRLTHDIVQSKLKINTDNFKLMDNFEYIHADQEFLVKHDIPGCQEIFPYSINQMHRQKRCPFCLKKDKRSFYELKIKKYLDSNQIGYHEQHQFDNLFYRRKLSCDFFIPEINLVIEYDGAYHFFPKRGENDLRLNKIRDNLKNEYCINNHIKLLRISMNENANIEKILDVIFKNSSTTINTFKVYYYDGFQCINKNEYYTNIDPNYFNVGLSKPKKETTNVEDIV